MEQEIYAFCQRKYNTIYAQIKNELTDNALQESQRGVLGSNIESEIEGKAQLIAIKDTIIEGQKLYPTQIPLLWRCIYQAHLYRKSSISDIETIRRVIQADQSWKSSSGHAFEEMVKELGTLCLQGTNIKYILQKDLNILLKAKELANQPTEIAWLEKQVKGSVFDAYVIADIKTYDDEIKDVVTKTICFGCVQCKTSIRDRVSRDIVPSKEAMESKFWSIGFVLDGTMFSVPKYKNMVNGNVDSEFKKNGWHGVYVLSAEKNEDRIYAVDPNFEIVKEHTIKAFNAWHDDRMGFSISWRADVID